MAPLADPDTVERVDHQLAAARDALHHARRINELRDDPLTRAALKGTRDRLDNLLDQRLTLGSR